MISASVIRELVEKKLSEGDNYLVDVTVSAANKIRVTIDNFRGISIEECVSMSRWIENSLDREAEDFELEVTSPGLDSPFRVFRQYQKNLGREVEVKLADGTKVAGKLVDANENQVTLEQETKEKTEGKKGRQLVVRKFEFPLSDIKETRLIIKF
jgi:ribosome maturation factor RimP